MKLFTLAILIFSITIFTACSKKEQIIKKHRSAYDIQKEKEAYSDLDKAIKK